ncbi:CHASE2 domain-containing protein [filamentous cyanobacterium LEGE 11480]|uniref:CHASE2 domain-containing protein n=1 Tax=Romeriopsis navalis LEGE 11480 TaxID=2777977 RepID=A0A928Z5B6_9CYAN|nr:CHASE2 domain-containing protein [Romeriopsis navalis]MBE9031832.1 CHASE2 domain-containing protein [Romeriopsis navalis LEGE 11480]
MSDIFISYSRRDQEFVVILNQALAINNRNTWIDWDGIPLGTDWWLEIQGGIEAADTFIFIVTPDSLASDVCKREIDHAVQHHKRVLPIVRRDTDMSLWPEALATHNALFFRKTDDFDKAFTRLLKFLDTDLRHLRMHTRLLVRAIEWEQEGQDSSYLLRDRDLAAAEQWLEQALDKSPRPAPQHLYYITASQKLQKQLQATAAAHQQAEQELQRALIYRKTKRRSVLWASLLVTLLLLIIRSFGLLQPLELPAYDHLLRMRPSEDQDPRFLIVEITESDIQNERREHGNILFSDASLDQLLKKITPLQPRLIGLDVYRDSKSQPPSLVNRLRQNDRIYGLCKTAEVDQKGQLLPNNNGTPMPNEIAPARVGFSDAVFDPDGIVRRHLLVQEVIPNTQCIPEHAFSLILAQRYLTLNPKSQNIQPLTTVQQLNEGAPLKVGSITLPRLQAGTAGYHSDDTDGGYQILLNYRATADPDRTPFDRISLAEILSQPIAADRIQNKIVLVGITATTGGDDYVETPYGVGNAKMPGVTVQAHMISQLLSAALDGRSLLWVWPQPVEALWTWAWALLGGLLAWQFQKLMQLAIAIGVATTTLTLICFMFMTQAGWVPLIPPGLALMLTSGLVVYLAFRRPAKLQLAKSQASIAHPANPVP